MKFLFPLIFVLIGCGNSQEHQNYPNAHSILDSMKITYGIQDFNSCIVYSQTYTELMPESDIGWQFLGAAYLQLGNDTLAVKSISKSLKINPNNFTSLTNYGKYLDRLQKYDSAEFFYSKALNYNDTLAEIYSNYLLNRIRVGDFRKAEYVGEMAIKYGDNMYDIANLCFVYSQNNNQIKSDSLFEILKSLGFSDINSLKDAITKN